MTAAVKKSAAQGKSKHTDEVSVAELVNKLPPELVSKPDLPEPKDLEKQQNSVYPEGVEVFTYQPEDKDAAPIMLPLNGFENPDKLWLFDVAELPILAQTWRWMTRANVPKGIQRQAQTLPDAEYFEMYNKWFAAMTAFRKGIPGSVTTGK